MFALLDQNELLSIFLEKSRSRSGKIQKPNEPVFDCIVRNYLQNHTTGQNKKDIKFVPISINYETVYEANTFPMELLGESKSPESLVRVLRQLIQFKKNLGKVIVQYGDPISLSEYLMTLSQKKSIDLKQLSDNSDMQRIIVANLGKDMC